MFGIRLPVNFLSPYLAISPSEFWRRWHITLSQWIRDYIYIPLGGSRGSLPRVLGVAVLTMALSGLWHGANWTFVVWGLYHGALLAIERLSGWGAKNGGNTLGRVISWAGLMTAVLFGWLLFRAQSFEVVGHYLRGMITGSGDASLGMRGQLVFALAACMGIQLWGYVDLGSRERPVRDWALGLFRPIGKQFAGTGVPEIALGIGMAVLVLVSLFMRSDSPVAAFIYFQF
jgi:D-alanyl-lipoteichoic acid acyltransferase DltB (MBOAT superfamily)